MTVPFSAQAQHLFARQLEVGLQRSKEIGRQVLVSVAFPVDIEISRVLELALSDTAPSMFWGQPSEGVYLAGAGEAYSVSGAGRDRFESLKSAHHQLLKDAVIDAPEEVGAGPICFSGFRFTEDGIHGLEWSEFPDGLLTLPKVMLSHTPSGAWCTLNAFVSPDAELPLLMEQCRGLLSKAPLNSILAPSDSVSSQHPHPGCQIIPLNPPLEKGEVSYFPLSKRGTKGDLLGVDLRTGSKARTSRTASGSNGSCQQSGGEPGPWKQAVQQVLHEIATGHLEKTVLARHVKLRAPHEFSIKATLEKLNTLYPECRIFAYHLGDTWFLGATPELLAQLRCGMVSSVCLAGTTGRGKTEAQDQSLGQALLNSPKDRSEHSLAVQAVQRILVGLCEQLDRNAVPKLVKLRNVQHLATTFSAKGMPGLHILDLVAELHPTPSVAGLPQDSALKAIQRLEGMDRGWYSGPVGWIDQSGDGEFAIAIRSALVRRNQASIYAGAGIVAGSDKDKEWEEVELKLNALRPLIEGAVNLAV